MSTKGCIMRPAVIDRLGDAGVSVVNLAIDAVDVKPGLPKALVPLLPYFDYLIKKQYRYGYSVFLNINICGNNMNDERDLTEITHNNSAAPHYHIPHTPRTDPPP